MAKFAIFSLSADVLSADNHFSQIMFLHNLPRSPNVTNIIEQITLALLRTRNLF